MIGRGVSYRKMDETNLCWSATVETGGRGCGIPQNGTPRDTVHLHRRPPPPPRATVDLLQPPRAPVHPASTARYSTGYCSTTPPRAPIQHLPFIPPSTPRGPIQPSLHGHPFTVYCSSSPPHHGVLFNHSSMANPLPSIVHPALHTTGSYSFRGNAPAHCSSNPPPPPRNAHCSSNRPASVSSNSKGIAPSSSVNSHRSITRVQ